MAIVGIYASSQANGGSLTDVLKKAHSQNGEKIIMVGDLNGKNKIWDRINNGRGIAVANFAKRRGYKITPPKEPSIFAKGKSRWSKQGLLLYKDKVNV